MLAYRDLTKRIIGLAIEVHRTIGPGRLESVLAACQRDERTQAGFPKLGYPRRRPRMAVESDRPTGYM